MGRGGGGDGGAGEACGDGDRVAGWGTSSAAGTGWAGSWMAEGLADGEGAAEADDGSAAEVRVVLAGAAGGAAAAGCPPPSVTASAMPSPLTASTPAAIATPERKLISSMRA